MGASGTQSGNTTGVEPTTIAKRGSVVLSGAIRGDSSKGISWTSEVGGATVSLKDKVLEFQANRNARKNT